MSVLTAFLALALLLHWPAVRALHELWVDTGLTTYTHGYLVAAICVFLLWRQRTAVVAARFQPAAWALPLLLLAELSWLYAQLAGFGVVTMLLLPPILFLGVCAAFGVTIARAIAFPLAYAYFATPLLSALNGAAQWATIYAVRPILQLAGISAFFDGNLVQIPAGTFVIEGGCSGLHFIIVAAAIAALLGELRGDRWRTRWLLLGLAVLLAVLANWLRVATIIAVGDMTHMQHYLVRVSHYGFGWWVFAMAMLVFFVMERRLPVAAEEPSVRTAPGQMTAQWAMPRRVAAFLAATGVLLALPLLLGSSMREGQDATVVPPEPPTGWSMASANAPTDWNPSIAGADGTTRAMFSNGSARVEFYGAWFHRQEQGKELSGYFNSIAGPNLVADDAGRVAVNGRVAGRLEALNAQGDRSVLLYGYRVDQRWWSEAAVAQLWYGWLTLLRLAPAPSSLIVVRATCEADSCVDADRAASELLAAVVGHDG